MATGNPLLAIHYPTTSTIRVYELLGNSFVQIASRSGYVQQTADVTTASPHKDVIRWSKDGTYIIFTARAENNAVVSTMTHLLAGTTQIFNKKAATSLSSTFQVVYAPEASLVYTYPVMSWYTSVNAQQLKIANDRLSATDFPQFLNPMQTTTHMSHSRNGVYGIGSSTTKELELFYQSGTRPNGTVIYDQTKYAIGYPTSMSKWSNNNELIVVVNSRKTSAEIYAPRVDNGVFSLDFLQVLEVDGIIANIEFSNNRDLAISTLVNGIYKTSIYKILGKTLMKYREMNNFGSSLLFTEDGLHLIDVITRAMYNKVDGVWSLATGAMNNVLTDAGSATMSPHVVSTLTQAKLYDDAFVTLMSGNPVDLRLFFLTDAAVYDPKMQNISGIANEQIVKTGDWPASGAQVAAPTIDIEAKNISFELADTKRAITSGFMQFRKGIIYNFTTGKPIAFYDFGSNVILGNGSRVTIKFGDDKFVSLV